MAEPSIHRLADVQTDCIGDGTRVWQFCVILAKATIGKDCNICSHVFIENEVFIGDRVTIKCGVQLWDGITIEDDVFIGPNVTFTNDAFPRSRVRPVEFAKTVVKSGASLGANATILPGVTIGHGAMVGAGAVVTSNVPPRSVVIGNPARVARYTDAVVKTGSSNIDFSEVTRTKIRNVRWIELTAVSDLRGELTVAQWNKHLPFVPKRVFFVHHVPSMRVRGEHAHRICDQILVAISGSVNVVLDDASDREEFVLAETSRALFIPAGVWASQYKYTPDAVIAVFASHEYDEKDYIRNYEDYLSYRKS